MPLFGLWCCGKRLLEYGSPVFYNVTQTDSWVVKQPAECSHFVKVVTLGISHLVTQLGRSTNHTSALLTKPSLYLRYLVYSGTLLPGETLRWICYGLCLWSMRMF